MKRPHINDKGQFQSDKYPTCPPGKVPLSVTDPTAQDLLWIYAERRRSVDAEFADDLRTALLNASFEQENVTPSREWFGHRLDMLARDRDAVRAILRALVEKLPECVVCKAPATMGQDDPEITPESCDAHADTETATNGYADDVDAPYATALRVAIALIAKDPTL